MTSVIVNDETVRVVTAGEQGPPGVGSKTGGVAGDMLLKNSSTNYDTVWTPPGTFLRTYTGTVYGHLWPGVTEGAGVTQAVRIANGLALQEALDYAVDNYKWFELEPGTYEIELAGGLIIQPNSHGFEWHGAYYNTVISQFAVNSPVLTVGSTANGGAETKALTLNGVSLQFGVDQTGQTSADHLVIGKCWQCKFRHITAGTATGFKPYRTVHIKGSSTREFYFQNTMEHCRFAHAQVDILLIGKNGTGNVYRDLYIGGGAPDATEISGRAINFDAAGAAHYESVMEQINVEWIKCNNPIYFNVNRNLTIISMHLEGNRLTGSNPMYFRTDSSQVNFIGLTALDNRMSTSDGVTGTPSIFSGTSNEGETRINGMKWTYEDPPSGENHVNTNFTVFNQQASVGRRTFTVSGFDFADFETALDATPYLRLSNLTGDSGYYTNVQIVKISKFDQSFPFPTLEHGYMTIAGTCTIYGLFEDMQIAAQSVASDYTVTLSRRKGPSGSVAENMPVRRGTTMYLARGSSGAGNMTIANWDGTTITTISTASAGVRLVFNGQDWQLATAALKGPTEALVLAASDETTDLTTGTAKLSFRMPFAFTLTGVRAGVNTAPTGSTLVVDINEGGTSILSTKLSIDASETTSTTAATAAVISDSSLADDALITIDIDQVGSSTPGKGLKVTLLGYKT